MGEHLAKYRANISMDYKERGDTYPNLFVGLLPIAAFLDNGHDDVFCCHERELLSYAPGDDLRVHDQPLGDVLQCGKNNVCCQKRFWERDSAIGTILHNTFISND